MLSSLAGRTVRLPRTALVGAGMVFVLGACDPIAAVLQVTPSSGSVPLAVQADASGSTDTDDTPISNYSFDFGDGTKVGPQSSAIANHTYVSPGNYTVTATAGDTGGSTSTASQSVSVAPVPIGVYGGYYDTHHKHVLQAKPDPWKGSANIVFVGQSDTSSGGWDTSAVRVDNLSNDELSLEITATIGRHTYDLWGSRTVPAGQSLILAQMGLETFDGSDTNTAGCVGCDPKLCTSAVSQTIPVINVTIGSTTLHYDDTQQILNTHGVDSAGCPYTGTRNDESESWTAIPGPRAGS